MWEDERDKEMMRNQMLAVVLMMALVFAWFTFFMPAQQPVVEDPNAATSAPTPIPIDSGERAQDALSARRPSDFVQSSSSGWPSLPPLPVQTDATQDEVLISDGALVLTFTRIGARLKRAEVLLNGDQGGSIQLVPEAPDVPDTEAIYPLGLRFTSDQIRDEIDYRRFDFVVGSFGKKVTFSLELPGVALIKKTFTLDGSTRVLNIDIEYENLEPSPRSLGLDLEPAYILNWGPGMIVQGEGTYFPPEMVWRKDLETHVFSPKDLPQSDGILENKRVPDVEWIGYKSKYFIAVLKPAGDSARVDGWAFGTEEAFRFGLYAPKFEVQPGETTRNSFKLYVGPMHLGTLSEAWPTLPTALRFFKPDGWFGKTVNNIMDAFGKILLRNLNWWYGYIPNYGIAIILMTVLVRMIMFPLTLKSMRSMKRMQALQPEMQALKEQYKDDQQALSQATMKMYKERGINPLAGCFPVLLQMPVFIALYRMLWNAFELRGASFLWIDDLSQPDRLFHLPFMTAVPIVGGYLEYFNLLPILVGLAMVVSMKVTPTAGAQNDQQKMMMRIMPIFFGLISYSFAGGLNLYVLTSTVLGILQSYIVRTTDIAGPKVETAPAVPAEDSPASEPDVKKKKRSTKPSRDGRRKKPQHFYDRAQQRKRETAKAGRKKSRKK